jgi:hypothetical protein
MKVPFVEANAKLYNRLYVSRSDIDFARYCAGVLLKKGWHVQPWEKRGTIYQQQTAFTSALVTAYARPFTKSKGWPSFPEELIPYDLAELELHKQLMKMRHKVFAHSDSESYSIKTFKIENDVAHLLTQPTLRLTAKEVKLFQSMTSKLIFSLNVFMETLIDTAGSIEKIDLLKQ